jgi:hypothetical protein
MFDFVFKSVDNALSLVTDVLDGEDIDRRKVSKLVADGISVAVIAEAAGVAVEVIEKLLESE